MIPTHYSFRNLRAETLGTRITESAAGPRSISFEATTDIVSPMSSIAGPGWEIFVPSPTAARATPISIPIPTLAPTSSKPVAPEAPEMETFERSTTAQTSRLFEHPEITEVRGGENGNTRAGPDIPDSQRFILPIRHFPAMNFEGTVLEGIV